MIAWGEAPGQRVGLFILRPVRVEQLQSIPRIPFVQWPAVLLAKPAILGLENLLLMMLRLVPNVFTHGLEVHRADAKLTVSICHACCSLLQLDDDDLTCSTIFRRRVVLGLCEQDVNVVAHGIDFDQGRVVVF